jgi:hypothetical protein
MKWRQKHVPTFFCSRESAIRPLCASAYPRPAPCTFCISFLPLNQPPKGQSTTLSYVPAAATVHRPSPPSRRLLEFYPNPTIDSSSTVVAPIDSSFVVRASALPSPCLPRASSPLPPQPLSRAASPPQSHCQPRCVATSCAETAAEAVADPKPSPKADSDPT